MAVMGGFYTDGKSVAEFKRLDVLKSRFIESIYFPFQDKTLVLMEYVHMLVAQLVQKIKTCEQTFSLFYRNQNRCYSE